MRRGDENAVENFDGELLSATIGSSSALFVYSANDYVIVDEDNDDDYNDANTLLIDSSATDGQLPGIKQQAPEVNRCQPTSKRFVPPPPEQVRAAAHTQFVGELDDDQVKLVGDAALGIADIRDDQRIPFLLETLVVSCMLNVVRWHVRGAQLAINSMALWWKICGFVLYT